MKPYLPTAKLAVAVLILLVVDNKLQLSQKIAARLPG